MLETVEYVSFVVIVIAGIYTITDKTKVNTADYPFWAKTVVGVAAAVCLSFILIRFTPLYDYLYHPIINNLILPIAAVVFAIHAFIQFKQSRKNKNATDR